MSLRAALSRTADSVPPLTPDGDEARKWAHEELSDPAYAAAQPTPLDRLARAIGDFFDRLFSAGIPNGWGSALAIVAVIVVVLLVVAAVLIWGLPRATRRSRATPALLFGAAETRSAAELRRDAASLAARGEWDGAIAQRFRALARGLVERDVVETPPGATVHAFARAAGRSFPALAPALEDAAAAFDDVRYLRRPGTRELYDQVVGVDEAVVAARPAPADPAVLAR